MVGESRKWMILVASIWVQAFTGTNFDFSSYSSDLKSVLNITQLQLNYLSVASDMGKAFGWCCGLSLMYFPLWIIMLVSAFLGLIGYGVQWLVIRELISLPYILVFVSCLVAGCSICWFNTVCYVLCIRHFPAATRAPALSLGISFNGVSAALYTLLVNAINSSNDSLYLLLNALVPLLISSLSLIPIISIRPPSQQPPPPPSSDSLPRDTLIFLSFYLLSLVTGLYLLLLDSISSNTTTAARAILVGAIFLLILPLFLPGFVYAREWTSLVIPSTSSFCLCSYSNFNDDDDDGGDGDSDGDIGDGDELDLRKGLIGDGESVRNEGKEGCLGKLIGRDQIRVIGEEHTTRVLVCRWDFWLYYCAYFCGGTIGLVYSNNLGQISQSMGFSSETSSLVTLYSTCSFFGRLLSAAPDFLRKKIYFARTGWFAVALVPTPVAFILLSLSGSEASLRVSTGLVGLSSGFVFSSAVSITSELFGANSAGVNHNILITNIPIGSFLYGLLAALVYDSNAVGSSHINWLFEMLMCMGRKCYLQTFIWWGCISMVGLGSSFLLFLRTRMAYDNFARNRNRTLTY